MEIRLALYLSVSGIVYLARAIARVFSSKGVVKKQSLYNNTPNAWSVVSGRLILNNNYSKEL